MGRGRELRNLEAVTLTRVRTENPTTSGIADDPHSTAARKGLVGQDVGNVQKLLQRLHPDHPGLAEEGVGGLVGNRACARGMNAPQTRRGTSALHRDDGSLVRDASAMRLNLRGFPNDSR